MEFSNDENKILDYIENEIEKLRTELQGLVNNEGIENDEINKLKLENTKLKHRLSILNAAIEKERENSPKNMTSESEVIPITKHLTYLFSKAIKNAYPLFDNFQAIITTANNQKFGDYQCNSAMSIAKLLKNSNQNCHPRDIANKIKENLDKSSLISKIIVADAGFINIFLDKSFGVSQIISILLNGVNPPYFQRKRVIVDFSSPNVAKEMHVGHLRSTIIGDSLSRLLEFLNHDVLRLNHIGDWGTQFGMLITHLEDRFPNFLTVSPPISDLEEFYKESKRRFDVDENFKKRAYNSVVKLQNGDKNATTAWQLICDVSRKEIQKIYDRLEVRLIERGESFYQSRMVNIVKELETNGFLENDEGRKIMWGDRKTNSIPLTIIKSDGGFTYDTSDMAALKQRLVEEKADWVIYVTDAGQAIHFKTIFDCAKQAGYLNPDKHRVDHVVFGVVLGENGKKFKTRSGETVKLAELLDEGLKRALEKLKEKERDKVLSPDELKTAQESIAYSCIKYADLCRNRNNEYVFSFDKMLEDRGNTAVYLLYAYTRIKSIGRNCGKNIDIPAILKTTELKIDHEKEWKLIKTLLKFPDVIIKITIDLCLHYLCEFAYEVCTTFTEFYDACYCIERNKQGEIVNININRILLCEATAMILEKCFYILGLKPISKI